MPECERMRIDITSLTREFHLVLDKLRSCEDECKRLRAERDSARRELASKERECHRVRAERECTRRDLHSKTRECESLRVERSPTCRELASKASGCDRLQSELDSTRADLKWIQSQCTEEIDRLTGLFEAKRRECDELSAAFEEVIRQVSQTSRASHELMDLADTMHKPPPKPATDDRRCRKSPLRPRSQNSRLAMPGFDPIDTTPLGRTPQPQPGSEDGTRLAFSAGEGRLGSMERDVAPRAERCMSLCGVCRDAGRTC
jgi:hypothetical protein